ncbi:hypothetical protein BWI17_17795 [Betaproteobacteria bacterium GR16-43]|nr:hypothetical protein BWI17_17795 [Betaproteobacteria bacterium GR16-43]
MNLANYRIGTRLAAGFGLLIVALVVLGVVSIVSLASIDVQTTRILEKDVEKLEASMDMEIWSRANSRRVYELSMSATDEHRKKVVESMAGNSARFDKAFAKLDALVYNPEGKALLEKMKAGNAKVTGLYGQVRALSEAGKAKEAEALVNGEVSTALSDLTKLLGEMGALQKKLMAGAKVEAKSTMDSARNTTLVIVALAVLFGLAAAWFITRSITRPIRNAVGAAEAVSHGDLACKIDVSGKDETSQLLSAMKGMVGTLSRFNHAQVEMGQRHDEGAISFRIDASKFEGAYREMAEKVNSLAAGHIAVKMKVVEVIGRYAKGDLSVDMDRLPGEKAKITDAMDGVKSSLTAINGEILKLTDAASHGDFSARGDAERFEYDFKKMIEGLNELMEVSDRGLSDVARTLEALAKGDLTARISADYEGTFGELKDNSNETASQLGQIVSQIREAADSIRTASGEIAQGNADLSQRTEEQASSLQETAASMEELTSTVKQNAENAKQANQLAVSASSVATQGGQVVSQVVETMGAISDSAKKIADIITVIDGIAFQTNILALNAAVEAARAGEQGRGFAVVAGEVRTLAQRSAEAAKEIKDLIGNSVEKVDAGSKLVNDAGQTMDEVVKSVKRVADIISEITAASLEQSAGIEQVNQAITQMDQVTQQNAALVEQAAAAAESMQEQAGGLAQAVSVFRLDTQPKLAAPMAAPKLAAPRTVGAKSVAKSASKPAAKPVAKAATRPASKNAVVDGDWKEF